MTDTTTIAEPTPLTDQEDVSTHHTHADVDAPIDDLITTNVEAGIFRTGVLLHVSASIYSGRVGQDEEDLRVQGVEGEQDAEHEVFVPGQKCLIRKEALEPFTQWRNRIKAYLGGVSSPFIGLKGVGVVKRHVIREVLDTLEGFKNELDGLVDAFMGLDNANYVAEQNIQTGVFDRKFPDRAGYLTQFYLTPDKVRRKFGLSWETFQITEVSDAERAGIRAEEASAIRERMGSYAREADQKMYKLIQSRLIVLAKAMEVKGTINAERIHRINEEIQKLKNLNVSDNAEITALIDSVSASTLNISNWKTDADGKRQLTELIEAQQRQIARELEENDIVVVQNGRRGAAAVDAESIEAMTADEEGGAEEALPVASGRRAAVVAEPEAEEEEGEDDMVPMPTSRASRSLNSVTPEHMAMMGFVSAESTHGGQ